jgi:cytoskeletal protein CcmA (bactofilin family)
MDRTATGAHQTGIPNGLTISGELSAEEDIIVHGRVDGQISSPEHHLTIGASAEVKAKLIARVVTIAGSVDGGILASERVRVLAGASVRGHITAPSLLLADGAMFTGTVDPERTEAGMHVARYRQKQSGEP